MNRFLKTIFGRGRTTRPPAKQTARLGLESLEAREVPAAWVADLDVGYGDTPTNQCVARSDNGNTVVVWEDRDITSNLIFAQVYNSAGRALSGAITVNLNTNTLGDSEPSVAVARDGRFVVVWSHKYYGTQDVDVYAQRFDRWANRLGTTLWVASDFNDESHPEVAMDANGNYAVAYEYKSSTTNTDIRVRQFNWSSTTPLRTVSIANPYENERDPAIDMNASGQFVVAYESAPGSWISRVYARSYTAAGAPASGALLVADGQSYGEFDPSVGISAAGKFVVAYTKNLPAYAGTAIVARTYSNNGALRSAPIEVGWLNAFPESNASVDMAADGRFVVAYVSHYTATDLDIVAQQFSTLGTPVGGAFYVAYSYDKEYAPTVAMDSYGNFTLGYGYRDLISGAERVKATLYRW